MAKKKIPTLKLYDILMVGGKWDEENGEKSNLFSDIYRYLRSCQLMSIEFINGGNIGMLEKLANDARYAKVVIWMPDIDDKLRQKYDIPDPGILKSDIVLIGGYKMLNGTDNAKSFSQILKESIKINRDYTVLFSKHLSDPKYNMLLFDDAGTYYYNGYEPEDLACEIADCIERTLEEKRPRFEICKILHPAPEHHEFIKCIRQLSKKIHGFQNTPIEMSRYCGSASFKVEDDDTIHVTRCCPTTGSMTMNDFISCMLSDDWKCLMETGTNADLDSHLYVSLFHMFKNVSHAVILPCYVVDAPMTEHSHTKGSLSWLDDIKHLVEEEYRHDFQADYYMFNLKNRGCLIMSSFIKNILDTPLMPRILPECVIERP